MPINILPSADYYNESNFANHGNYQYISLEDIVNNYMMNLDSDDHTSLIPRFRVLYQARRGMKELYYDVVQEIRVIELELSPTLNITLPPDFVNYVRISWVDDQGLLHPMAEDRSYSIAQQYLQDHEYKILFDDQGCPLQGSDGFNEPMESLVARTPNNDGSYDTYNEYEFCTRFAPNLDNSRVFNNGKYIINKTEGFIQFGSNAVDRRIVLEYISDGLYTGCEGRAEAEIRIHKFAETALLDWIYWNLIKTKRNVPNNEKRLARAEYYNSKRVARRRIQTLRSSELLHIFRGDSVWIKQ